MSEELTKALYISALGVGLVFLGILVLWGMMELAGRLTAPRKPKTAPIKPEKPSRDFVEARRKAAAAAVITAMALQNTAFTASSHRKREAITPWQTAYRSHQLRSAIAANNRRKKDR
jgi:Na+-transporting methylmalonyl-CoA/oxaloacetate decarboxylase gamma subunit